LHIKAIEVLCYIVKWRIRLNKSEFEKQVRKVRNILKKRVIGLEKYTTYFGRVIMLIMTSDVVSSRESSVYKGKFL